jgi:hypothetical protein
MCIHTDDSKRMKSMRKRKHRFTHWITEIFPYDSFLTIICIYCNIIISLRHCFKVASQVYNNRYRKRGCHYGKYGAGSRKAENSHCSCRFGVQELGVPELRLPIRLQRRFWWRVKHMELRRVQILLHDPGRWPYQIDDWCWEI